MEECQHQCVLCYADDCLIYTKTDDVEDHIRDIKRVFAQLEKYGIKVKASKLKLGCREMPFLGVVITEDGIKPNPDQRSEAANNPEATEKGAGHFCLLSKVYSRFQQESWPPIRANEEGHEQ